MQTHMHTHTHNTLSLSSVHLSPAATHPALEPSHLEHLPIHLCIGFHSVLREHEGDEGKALGFLGQAVDGVVKL